MTLRALPSILGVLVVVFTLLIVAYVTGQADAPVTSYMMQVPGNLVLIPSGTFDRYGRCLQTDTQKSRDQASTPQTVRVEAFYMGRYDVTTAEYARFLNDAILQHQIEVRQDGVYLVGGNNLLCETYTLCKFSRIDWDGETFSVRDKKENHPMVCVRWEGAVAYCNWLSIKEGYDVCYDPLAWKCDFTVQGFRLPTGAEWAYAAYGSQNTVFPWGNEPDTEKANGPHSNDPYETGAQPWTTPAGFFDGTLHTKAEYEWPGDQTIYQTGNGATLYGLSDMAGNVWQWCNDPAAISGDKPCLSWCGGNWYDGTWGTFQDTNHSPNCYQVTPTPEPPYFNVGFRVALPLNIHPAPISP